ncbi:hypothetical protein BH20ACT5_BH20ACT5_01540 [soil metagenome]
MMLRPELDVSPAQWLAPRLSGRFGAVTRQVPAGYPAYARVFHPAHDEHGEPVSWAHVAEVTSRQVHPTMQWHALIGSADSANPASDLWPGDNPEIGNLAAQPLAALCDVLARHTGTAETCWFCLWEGYGWIHGSPSVSIMYASTDPNEITSSPAPVPPALSQEQLDGPRVRHPHRDYFLFSGPLPAAVDMGWQVSPDWFDPQSPNLFWPEDRAWCVASEIDFDSTLVGGSTALVEALVAEPGLEVWPVEPDDSLAHDADKLNHPPS